MRVLLVIFIVALMGSPLGIIPNYAQDTAMLSAELFADRSILLPNSSYPLVALAHDSKGQIYALAFDQVVKLSHNGELIKRLSLQKGQGPGEVQNLPSVMTIGLDDYLYIYDGAKIVVYTTDLTFIRNIPIMMSGREVYADKESNLYCRKGDFSSSEPEEFLAKYNPQGKLVGTYIRTHDLTMSLVGRMVIGTPHPYVPRNIFCMDSRGVMFFLHNIDSQVSFLDPQGTAISAFTVATKEISISSDERTEVERIYVGSTTSNVPMKAELHYADYRPYYRKILIDGNDRFYLVRTESVLAKGKETKVDIYQTGRERTELRIAGDPLIVHQGYLYFLVNKDDGTGELTGAIMRVRAPH